MKEKFEIDGKFSTKQDVLEVVPFYFNEDNSNISVCMFIDGLVTITVVFGNGKGWDTIEEDLRRETELSCQWGDYTLGYV